MGPLFFRAENGPAGQPEHGPEIGFNGAALFQSGEHNTRPALSGHCNGFNGAALFQSGEHVAADTIRHTHRLQWGRSFSERRTPSACPASRWMPSSFNGAALFQSGERPPWPGMRG